MSQLLINIISIQLIETMNFNISFVTTNVNWPLPRVIVIVVEP